MEKELRSLVTKRGALKGQLTRFENFVNNLGDSAEQLVELEKRTQKVEGVLDDFNALQSEIEVLDSTSDHAKEHEEFENQYFKITALAEKNIAIWRKAKQSKLVPEVSPTVIPDNLPPPAPSNSNNSILNIKLPDINLPEFTGNYDNWVQFHDTFNALIHENLQLTTIQKFYYLQASLKGDAAKSINNLEITDANYPVAWNLLKERYQNEKIIIHSHMKNIFELPTVTKESHTSLRQFLDTFLRHFRALENLEQPVDTWDTILIYLLSAKLDTATKREWEISTKNETSPKITNFTNFLHNRCLLLETLNSKVSHNYNQPVVKKVEQRSYSHVSSEMPSCIFCNGPHYINLCNKFLDLSPSMRFERIKALNKCINCFKAGHSSSTCRGGTCKKCQKRHNTLLHFENASNAQNNLSSRNFQRTNANAQNSTFISQNTYEINRTTHSNMQQLSYSSPNSLQPSCNTPNAQQLSLNDTYSTSSSHYSQSNQDYILLSTAIIFVLDSQGNPLKCRALLDSGSQSNFITQRLFDKLNIKSTKINVPVTGINQLLTHISNKAQCTIKSTHNDFASKLNFLILDNITENVPQISINYESLQIPSELPLADPEFFIPGPVDILLGASIFWTLLLSGQIKMGKANPIIQRSVLGWIISGPISCLPTKNNTICNLTTSHGISNKELNEKLEKFWLVENSYSSPQGNYSQEQSDCEAHFIDNFYRDEEGRFTVSLPFRDNNQLGSSREQAIKRFYAVERKLQNNPTVYKQYKEFMLEYEMLNHMKQIDKNDLQDGYYLPHHSVLKAESLTTKLRVVFDASAKTTNNKSLNDVLMVGPCIQDDLFSILVRFRKHNVVLIADVTKMYRQIWINKNDHKYQRIVWRANKEEKLKHFELQTITYGTAPASFLATRCLQQVAIENKNKYPLSYEVIMRDFYMDDLLSGACNTHDAIKLKQNLEYVLSSAGFKLRKWISNDPNVLKTSMTDLDNANYIISDDKNIKTLGMSWNSNNDTFYFSLNHDMVKYSKINFSKRIILSTVAQIYDPLGLLSCVIITAKCILQQLWKNNIDWDQTLPPDVYSSWLNFFGQLPLLNKLQIPRQITSTVMSSIQLHGFCDASEIAYSACLYLKTVYDSDQISVRLICAKARVAPVKALTLPKLELCGAVLLAKLAKRTIIALDLNIKEIFFWCDSSIVLAWIAAHPSNWKTFVCNRVSEIQQLTDGAQWRHVRSGDNPADIGSRGCTPVKLLENNLWWNGPSYLMKQMTDWPQDITRKQDDIPEIKTKNQIALNVTNLVDIFDLYSSFSKLQHVMAYCLRFINRLKLKSKDNISPVLTIDELNNATLKLVKLAQQNEFSIDIQALKQFKCINKKSKLVTLNPFLDDNEILRVGGRLAHAKLNFDRKYPMVLPTNHQLTKLIIRHEHYKNLHCGPQLLLSTVRKQFWPLKGRQAVRSVLRKCMICFRAKPPSLFPQMGNLPSFRVNPSRIFHSVGTDFAGPYLVKDGKLRNRKLVKSYFCVFICLATKAVHLEPVGDLTTNNFLSAFKRFIARRGCPKHLYSDNATNFVGADNELKNITKLDNDKIFQLFLAHNQIEWHFIPARSPHFGGIWEAAVKSVKHHLKRIIGNFHFTYEEFYTLLTQVEAILNSRPLMPLTDDPNDMEALTPGHFIIGEALTAVPQENLHDTKFNRLSRFEHLQQMTQHFWASWSNNYLHTLQERTKWKLKSSNNILNGALVLLKEDKSPPQRWRLGRIMELHPGSDGVIRVVTVKTDSGVVKRAVARVCILPID